MIKKIIDFVQMRAELQLFSDGGDLWCNWTLNADLRLLRAIWSLWMRIVRLIDDRR